MEKLPIELLWTIAELSDVPTLARLTTCCCRFYWLFNTLLYQRNKIFQNSSAIFWATDSGANIATALGTLRAAAAVGADFGQEKRSTIQGNLPRKDNAFVEPSIITKLSLPFTPLHSAAARGLDDVVCFLLDQGVGINCNRTSHEWPPLFVSICYKHISTAVLLMDRGASLILRDETTALHIAAAAGLLDLVTDLVKSGKSTRG
jgi:hypothetical protein